MYQLILKDFAVQKKYFLTYVFMGIFFFVFFGLMGQMGLTSLVLPVYFIVYGFLNRSLYEDEKNNNLRLIVALPIEKKIIVYSKYLGVALFFTTVSIVFFIVGFFTGIFNVNQGNGLIENAAIAVILIVTFLILMSIYLPLVFKLGYIRAVGINRFIFLGIFALFTLTGLGIRVVSDKIDGIISTELKNGIINFVSSINPYSAMIGAAAAGIAIYFASMMLSVRFFNKRNIF